MFYTENINKILKFDENGGLATTIRIGKPFESRK